MRALRLLLLTGALCGLGVSSATGAPRAARPRPGSLVLRLPDVFAVHREAVTIPRRVVHVEGRVRPYVPGQWVILRATQGGRRLKVMRLRIRPFAGAGRFTGWVAAPRAGTVRVRVEHRRNAAQVGFLARRTFVALDPSARPGATGRFVQLVQGRLAALHLFLRQSGVLDGGTALALDAYHRLLGWGTSPALDHATVTWLLNGWGAFRVRFPRHGRHAEGDLGAQLLALADGPRVVAIFPISSGKPSTPTVLGDYRIYRRSPGRLPDGMYFSDFFTGGYAIHGYDPAPDYPASHGCMRLPMADAIPAYDWLALGDWVDVYA